MLDAVKGLGLALTSLSVSCACNSPWCVGLAGPSEAQLVSARSNICAGCKTARYGSKECQRKQWKHHKPVCKALAAAAAAGKG